MYSLGSDLRSHLRTKVFGHRVFSLHLVILENARLKSSVYRSETYQMTNSVSVSRWVGSRSLVSGREG